MNAQHGKNTLAEIIKDYYEPGQVEQMGFADALREMALGIDPPVEYDQLTDAFIHYAEVIKKDGYEKAKENPEVRRFLQRLGTEGVRQVLGDDTWIRALDFKRSKSKAALVVVTDCRFENECDYIEENGELWGVFRPNFDNGMDKSHPSESYIETALTRTWKRIHATSLDDLRSQVIEYLDLREKHYSLIKDWSKEVV